QIEWTPLAPPDQQYKLSAIDECIDFDTYAGTVNPPDGSGVTLPRLWPYPPVAVPTASHAGTDGRPMPPAALRPLCAPVNIVPGQGSNYGVKSDGEMHHVMGGPVFWPTTWLVDPSVAPGDGGTGLVYVAPENLPVVAYKVRQGHLLELHASAHRE